MPRRSHNIHIITLNKRKNKSNNDRHKRTGQCGTTKNCPILQHQWQFVAKWGSSLQVIVRARANRCGESHVKRTFRQAPY